MHPCEQWRGDNATCNRSRTPSPPPRAEKESYEASGRTLYVRRRTGDGAICPYSQLVVWISQLLEPVSSHASIAAKRAGWGAGRHA
jgi:hypothetical protein